MSSAHGLMQAGLCRFHDEIKSAMQQALVVHESRDQNPFFADAATIGDISRSTRLVTLGHHGVARADAYEVVGEVIEKDYTAYFLDATGEKQHLYDMGVTSYAGMEGLFVWNRYYFTIVDTPENRQRAIEHLLNLHKEARLAGDSNLAAQESARLLLELP